tara:strand:+ start:1402 stop:1971 length:570 start_codon:yes stop_codon:yes gene_type:complete
MNKSIILPSFISLIGIGILSDNETTNTITNEKVTVIDSTYVEDINGIGGEWIKDIYTIELNPIKFTKKEINQIKLIKALIQVESNGKEDCVGDRHLIIPSIGVLQIRPIMVREVNRILKLLGENQRYKNKDRYSRIKSIEMFIIWRDYHHKNDSDEVIARCWNGGPKGYKRKKTLHYWNKIQKEINKLL